MGEVFRCFVEKKPGFDGAARALCRELTDAVGIQGLTGLRVLNRYDVEGVTDQVYAAARTSVFSEPQVDTVYDEHCPLPENPHTVLAVEALPGQFDQRADSAAQCIQLMTGGERPTVRAAAVYLLLGTLSAGDVEKVRSYLINPVEAREASLDKPDTLLQTYPIPQSVKVLEGFGALDEKGLRAVLEEYGLAMDLADLTFFQSYMKKEEGRDPTITELRLVDTYWSDHCRHTTFSTHIDQVEILSPEVKRAYRLYQSARKEVYGEEKAKARPETLMDLATIAAKVLKKRGILKDLDESEEINACSVHVTAHVDGQNEDWLLMFKNETHNHPTEIEPFGGAATCIGGAIRDPLSGRSYVYQAMRVTGCGDPRTPLSETLEGKLPQRKLCTTAAAGYSSYGNQIGLATGLVSEIYHPGYVAKHMEVGAVVGAAPASNVVRERPAPGDRVILLGGRTGRDGIGGATGSSKSHDLKSLDTMASEVQKGNAPEERKLQRLFRNPEVTRLIKRCNDFGAGGVSVAVGELADGLDIDLDAVRKKYDGLDGTELAISESQERMAVVVAQDDVEAFIAAASAENLEAYVVAQVTEAPRMVMRWNGAVIADLSREFLSSNGADKHTTVVVPPAELGLPFAGAGLRELCSDLNLGLQRGLGERFDGTIGAGSVLMPFGGKTQTTPAQAMAALLPVAPGKETDTCSVMAWGFRPRWMEKDPFHGAGVSVIDSVAKLVASGCDPTKVYLSFQEYFEKLRNDPIRWGKPFAALLGAFTAQIGLGVAAIGGKDSMSGSFLGLDVPPTLVSFAIAPEKAQNVITPEFKEPGHPVYLFHPSFSGDYGDLKAMWMDFHKLCQAGHVKAAWAVTAGGSAEAVIKMSFGNRIGFNSDARLDRDPFWITTPGAIVAECDCPVTGARLLGYTSSEPIISLPNDVSPIDELLAVSEGVLEDIYPTRTPASGDVPTLSCTQRSPAVCRNKTARPKAVIPVFPGTNCEYDTARACLRAGIAPEIVVVRNLNADLLAQSAQALEQAIQGAQMIVLPGGFSGGDEPDGSAKFICSFFRNPRLTDAVHDLLKHRDGLMLGICNGFQALIKLGLVPYGEIRPTMDEKCATLTYNDIGRHQSRYVTTRVASVHSPWMLKSQVGDLHTIPISHGEGKFVAPQPLLDRLIANGQVATQYVDLSGEPSMDISANPNGSLYAIEGIFSPDGRVFGKMGHSERRGEHLAKNIPGDKFQPIFESGAAYFG
ncbi:phosphoribosylformylglycinamidine synthase [Intestinimonas butyriciproducens]|uniref:phosphoribosylformylglycinamidine synthase n=1 Tax=Intestinimonas butyriciproducens TaxID=1297617 RepID=UPI0019591F7A|nr:phosphoribosylformylglycinamidine synthase [Intestinimonas butyriciproducens]MBM6975466.1 phosphoribosylformylglycinamidine synthase [Intestinimonas butyriciproducens]